MTIEEKYQQFLDTINGNELIEIDQEFTDETELWRSEMSDTQFRDSILKHKNLSVPDDDLKFIQFSDLSISWNSVGLEPYTATGGFQMNGMTDSVILKSVFWKGAFSLAITEEVPHDLKHFEKLGWFEKQALAQDGRYGCFIREGKTFPLPIAFYDSGWYIKLDMNLEEYLTTMFKMYAIKGWQFFFVDVTKEIPNWERAIRDMEIAVDVLPKLFPDDDWTNQIEHLKTTKENLS